MSRTYDNLKRRRRTDGTEEPPDLGNLELFAFAKEKEQHQPAEPAAPQPPSPEQESAPSEPARAEPPPRKPRARKPKGLPPPPIPPPPAEAPEPEFGGPTRRIEYIEESAEEPASLISAARQMEDAETFEPPVGDEAAVAEPATREEPADDRAMEFPPQDEEPVEGVERESLPPGEPAEEPLELSGAPRDEAPAFEPEPVFRQEPAELEPEDEPESEAPLLRPGRPLRAGGISPLTGVPRPAEAAPDHSAVVLGAAIVLLGALLIGALYGVVRGIARSVSRKPVAVQAAKVEPPAPEPPASVMDFNPAPAAKAGPAPKPAPARPPGELSLSAPGAKVTVEGRVQIVVFSEGLFEGGVTLGRNGRRQLARLAGQLAPHAKNVSVTVIGCTDNVKLSPKSKYKDNRELGLLRAGEVARFLQAEGGLPAAAFQTLSFGTQWSPYPNDTPEDRARNRTAVLRISLRK